MSYLIDTHTFFWAISQDQRLSRTARDLIEDLSNSIYISIASLWEMAIKLSLDKLELEDNFESLIPREINNLNIHILSIDIDHLVELSTLPLYVPQGSV